LGRRPPWTKLIMLISAQALRKPVLFQNRRVALTGASRLGVCATRPKPDWVGRVVLAALARIEVVAVVLLLVSGGTEGEGEGAGSAKSRDSRPASPEPTTSCPDRAAHGRPRRSRPPPSRPVPQPA
jgi:hypothetical protein